MNDPILSPILEGVRQVVREELARMQRTDDETLTKREAAKFLKISESTLMRKVARKELSMLKGTPPRFLRSELERVR